MGKRSKRRVIQLIASVEKDKDILLAPVNFKYFLARQNCPHEFIIYNLQSYEGYISQFFRKLSIGQSSPARYLLAAFVNVRFRKSVPQRRLSRLRSGKGRL